jgi:hypothetical protein
MFKDLSLFFSLPHQYIILLHEMRICSWLHTYHLEHHLAHSQFSIKIHLMDKEGIW